MKPYRNDRKLGRLTAAQRKQLVEWLLDEGISYPQAQERLLAQFGIKVGEVTVGRFYLQECIPQRLRRAAEAANRLPAVATEMMSQWDAVSSSLVRQRYFELLAAPTQDPKELALFASQIVHIDRERLDREKLRFQRQQAAAALRLKRRSLVLSKWKSELRAADLALRFAKQIKTIAADRSLDASGKVELVRQRLFGTAPKYPELGNGPTP